MLGERDGTATFAPGAPAIMRRIHEPTRSLVTEARALVDRAAAAARPGGRARRRARCSPSTAPIADSLSEIDQHVLSRLRVPAMLDDILDELPHADAAILESIVRLDARGRVKRLGHTSSRVQLCGPDQLHLLRAAAARARSAGLRGAGAPRLRRDAVEARRLRSHGALARRRVSACGAGAVRARAVRARDHPARRRRRARHRRAAARAGVRAALADGARRRSDPRSSRRGRARSRSRRRARASSVPILDARAIFGALEESSAVQVASLIKTALDADGSGLG